MKMHLHSIFPSKLRQTVFVAVVFVGICFQTIENADSKPASANREEVLVLEQEAADIGKFEIYVAAQHVRIRSLSQGWTLVASSSSKDLYLFKDGTHRLCKSNLKEFASVSGKPASTFVENPNLDLPPLRSTTQRVIKSITVTDRLFTADPGSQEYQTDVSFRTLVHKNVQAAKLMYALYGLKEFPGLPIQYKHKGSYPSYPHAALIGIGPRTAERTRYSTYVLTTTSWKEIADSPTFWKIPEGYSKVTSARDITLQNGWQDVVGEYGKMRSR